MEFNKIFLIELLQKIDEGYNPTKKELQTLREIRIVDFSNSDLSKLPKSIVNLVQLTFLNISGNELQELPENIGSLTQLAFLSISSNKLQRLPESIGNLTQLTFLSISGNELQELPESIGNLTQLTRLDIFGNKLQELPESIGSLTKLTNLDISVNELHELPESIDDLTQLTRLDISSNKLQELPKSIGCLTQIAELNISGNKLQELPESIGNLTQLTSLDIFDNELQELPESIGNLTQLTSLDIFGNELHELPESIGCLTKLTSLGISVNKLQKIPESIGSLTKLISLDISGNELQEIPESIGSLTKLTNLDISVNKLQEIPESIGSLTKLTNLDISVNELQEIPESIGSLTKLAELNISSNKLKELPESIGNLTQLTSLDISVNELHELPDSIGSISTLKSLYLNKLRLIELPVSLLQLKLPFLESNVFNVFNVFNGIYLKDTELSIQPISLFNQSRDFSRNYQESRKLIENYFNTEKIPICEAKVIFLGDGKVGKTYTIKRLLNDCRKGDYPTEETHGILIENLEHKIDDKLYTLRIWDFGGQDIMHEMHRCFLTERTCYVVMVDTRANYQTGRARYWLRTVQNIAPNAPVLLLVNEINNGKNRDIDYAALKQEFSNLVDVQYCSSMNAGDDEFRVKIKENILKHSLNLDSCKMLLPASWEAARQELLEQKKNKIYYIDRNQFHSICDKHGVPADIGLRTWLLTWFNDLGVCFSYHLGDNGLELSEDYKILDPMWLTSAVYKIIWEKNKSKDGLIARSEIYQILKQKGSEAIRKAGIPCLDNVSYNEQECNYVLDIMHMFCISYAADKYTEFMPVLCDTDSILPDKAQTYYQHIKYSFKYTILPETVLHRLMIYCFKNLRLDWCWRKGFWLECEAQGLSAVICIKGQNLEENELIIEVFAQKEKYGVWTWLQVLCQEIININETLSLTVKDGVYAENNIESKWFSMESILLWYKRGAQELQGEYSPFSIIDLLNIIYGDKYINLNMDKYSKIMNFQNISAKEITLDIAKNAKVNFRESLQEQALLIEALAENKRALQQNTKALNKSRQSINRNTMEIDNVLNILSAIRDNYLVLPEEVLDELTEILKNSEEQKLAQIGNEMSQKPNKLKIQLLRNFLQDSANVTMVVPAIMEIFNKLSPVLQTIQNSDVIQNISQLF